MSDFDTRRVGEIATLEQRLEHVLGQLAEYKATAEKWEPKVAGELMLDQQKAKVSLTFAGKSFSAVVSYPFLQEMDLTGASTQIIEALFEGLIKDKLREVIQPEVERLQRGALSMKKVGTW